MNAGEIMLIIFGFSLVLNGFLLCIVLFQRMVIRNVLELESYGKSVDSNLTRPEGG